MIKFRYKSWFLIWVEDMVTGAHVRKVYTADLSSAHFFPLEDMVTSSQRKRTPLFSASPLCSSLYFLGGWGEREGKERKLSTHYSRPDFWSFFVASVHGALDRPHSLLNALKCSLNLYQQNRKLQTTLRSAYRGFWFPVNVKIDTSSAKVIA